MRDAKALRTRIRLLLENKKQNTFAFLESTRRKSTRIHQRNNRQKSEFLLISIILKNVYRLKDLFKSSIKLNRQ